VSQGLKGILFALAAAVFFATMAGIVRYLGSDVDPIEIAFFRNVFGSLMFVPALMRMGTKPLKTDKLGLLCIRSVCNALSMTLFFMALAAMPLVEVTALNFTIPLWVTIAAGFFLHEKLGAQRWLGLAIGFVGALIILRPGAGMVDWGALYVLLSAAVWSIAVVDIKVLSRTESAMTITLYGALFNGLLILPAALFVWTWPTWTQLAWLCAMGICGTLDHLLYAQALRLTEANVVTAFDFTRLIWAGLIGAMFFAEFPDIWTFVGAVVIFGSAMWVTVRESQAERARKAEAAGEPAPAG
jgi:drug/metabolite transporter (DMT)-like permease